MELIIKNIRFEFDCQTSFVNVTIGNMAVAVSALMDADELEKLGRTFLQQAKLLRGDN